MSNEIQHFGVMGMRWGKHKLQEKARFESQRTERARFQSDLKKAGKKASTSEVTAIAKTHDKNMAKIDAEFEKATGRKLPKGPVGDRVANWLGMRKDKNGVWRDTPEAWAKATTIGVGVGFASFFAELAVKNFVAKGGVDNIIKSAEYANWLKNG